MKNFAKSTASLANSAFSRLGAKFGIGAKFITIVTSILLFAALLAIVAANQILSKNMEDVISARLTSDAYHKIDILNRFFSEILRDLEVMTSAHDFALRENIDKSIYYLKYFSEKKETYASLSIYNAKGVKIGDTKNLEIGKDESAEQFFKKSISGGVYFDSAPFLSESLGNLPVFRIALPIKGISGDIEGVLLANIPLSEIEKIFLIRAANFSNMNFHLLNQDGILIASDRKGEYSFNKDLGNIEVFKLLKISNRNELAYTTQYQGEERLFIGVKSREIFGEPGAIWYLFASIPTSDVFSPILNAEIGIIIIGIGFLLLVIPFIILAAGTITKPLYTLEKAAERIAKGDFNQKIEVSSQDEVGQLVKAFNTMAFRLKMFYSSLEDKNKELSEVVHIVEEKNKDLEKTEHAVEDALENVKKQKDLFQRQIVETKKFQQAVESSSDAIFITDNKAHILYANPAWEKLNGYSLEEVIGKNTNIMKSGKTPEELYKKMWEAITRGEMFFTEDLINCKKNGQEYEAQLTVYPIKEGDRVIFFVGVESDITERKMIERSKNEFVSIASHQLRTPLTTMNLFTEMIEKGDVGKLNKKQQEYIYKVRHSIKRMIVLVNDLLSVSRIETGRLIITPKPAFLEDVIEDVVKECRLLATGKFCNIEFKNLTEKLPAVPVDENLLHQVIHNLAVNAITYSPPERCKISISLNKREKEKDYLISVKDEGIGIPESAKLKLFEKFYRADNAVKMTSDGTGLGLYLVKMVMQESGGDVWFESVENKGSTFYVSIPFDGMKQKAGEKTLEIV